MDEGERRDSEKQCHTKQQKPKPRTSRIRGRQKNKNKHGKYCDSVELRDERTGMEDGVTKLAANVSAPMTAHYVHIKSKKEDITNRF